MKCPLDGEMEGGREGGIGEGNLRGEEGGKVLKKGAPSPALLYALRSTLRLFLMVFIDLLVLQ